FRPWTLPNFPLDPRHSALKPTPRLIETRGSGLMNPCKQDHLQRSAVHALMHAICHILAVEHLANSEKANGMKTFFQQFGGVFLLLFATNAPASTHYVDIKSTNASPPSASWATAAVTIQDAVDAG